MYFGHLPELIIIGSLILLVLVVWIIWHTLDALLIRGRRSSVPDRREAVDTDSAVMDQVWRDFPRDQQYQVATALATYGEQPYEREVVRVQLAILALARGDMDKLLKGVERAKRDYRDVLVWSVENRSSEGV
jgi:hypothetical protein